MKKFLALLFVCAGLTAMAGVPQLNKANFTKVNKAQKVMTAATSNDLVVKAGQNVMTPREFFKQHNVTPSQNMLNKAPRRLSDEDVAATDYLDFRYVYDIDDSGLVWNAYHFRGGEGNYWQVADGQLYCAGIYWNQYTGSSYYLPVDIDYTTGDVLIDVASVLDDDTIEGTYNSQTRLKVDTVNYSIFVDSEWFLGNSEEFSPIPGKIYPDGTIEFSDEIGYVFAGYQAVNSYSRTGNAWTGYTYTLQSTDTTFFTEIYYGTQFIVPNATHEWDMVASSTTHNTEGAYMYQYDDTTAVVFNLWGLGMPGVEMNIYADGTMKYPLDWPISEMGPMTRNYYANYYGSAYNWDDCRWYWPIALEWSDEEQDYVDLADSVIVGTVDATSIHWGPTMYYLPGIVRVSDGAEMSLSSYPFINNVLNFTDGSEFVFETPNPIIRGDVNNDGVVNISDVTTLINHLLNGDFDESDTFSPDNADCDESGSLNISDVTSLINYLLKGTW